MLIDRQSWPQHRPWVLLVSVAAIAATAWFVAERLARGAWPGGGSLPGFTFGVVGGILILFEMLLWVRKKKRVWRVGLVQTWLRAHIWLGLLTLPLMVYHSGLRFGGTLSTWLMVLFLITIASGIWGLLLQQYLPRKMLNEVPAETIYSQIDHISDTYCRDAAQLVRATCGPDENEEEPTGESEPAAAASFVTVGAVRSSGRFQGKVLLTRVPDEPVPDSEPLRVFFRQTVVPYLQGGKGSGSPLSQPNRSVTMFQELRTRLHPEAHGAVDALEELCNQRRQLDHQAAIHGWLHGWLWVHLPVSVAMTLLMFIHIYVALKYW